MTLGEIPLYDVLVVGILELFLDVGTLRISMVIPGFSPAIVILVYLIDIGGCSMLSFELFKLPMGKAVPIDCLMDPPWRVRSSRVIVL